VVAGRRVLRGRRLREHLRQLRTVVAGQGGLGEEQAHQGDQCGEQLEAAWVSHGVSATAGYHRSSRLSSKAEEVHSSVHAIDLTLLDLRER
jgi:hypothetical protein